MSKGTPKGKSPLFACNRLSFEFIAITPKYRYSPALCTMALRSALLVLAGHAAALPTTMTASSTASLPLDQPESTVKLTNGGSDTMFLYLQYATSTGTLNPPKSPWSKRSGDGSVGNPTLFGPHGEEPANDVGAGTWQVAKLDKGMSMLLDIPEFTHGQAWSIRALKYIDGKPCTGGGGACGMPILIEAGKDMVGDMSAVDGVNYNLKYEMTTAKGATTIDFKGNPCKAIGAASSKGCRNPQIDFVDWKDPACPAGTCKTEGKQRTWCDAVHDGQCANSTSHWEDAGVGYAGCAPQNKFTTYCYSHDDANSSPTLAHPYQLHLTYSDLA